MVTFHARIYGLLFSFVGEPCKKRLIKGSWKNTAREPSGRGRSDVEGWDIYTNKKKCQWTYNQAGTHSQRLRQTQAVKKNRFHMHVFFSFSLSFFFGFFYWFLPSQAQYFLQGPFLEVLLEAAWGEREEKKSLRFVVLLTLNFFWDADNLVKEYFFKAKTFWATLLTTYSVTSTVTTTVTSTTTVPLRSSDKAAILTTTCTTWIIATVMKIAIDKHHRCYQYCCFLYYKYDLTRPTFIIIPTTNITANATSYIQ